MNIRRSLSALDIAVSLVSVHYGLGFLIGTGQSILEEGISGMMYALSCGIGILSLLLLYSFYWKKYSPIWRLFGKKYGQKIQKYTAFLSGFWMYGVVASQILGGGYVLSIVGIPFAGGMLCMAIFIFIVSLFPIKQLSQLFFMMLMLGSGMLAIALLENGIQWVYVAGVSLVNTLPALSQQELLGVFLPTVLITALGMDFHQFVVRGKTLSNVKNGILLGGVLLLVLSFLLGGLVLSYLPSLNQVTITGQVIPHILLQCGRLWFGNQLAILALLPILLVAIGSGSGVLRIVALSQQNVINLRLLNNKHINIGISVLISLGLAFSSDSLIVLIVTFYASYVAAILIPFIAYFLEENHIISIDKQHVFLAMLSGFISAIALYGVNSIFSLNMPYLSLYMMFFGWLISGAIIIHGTSIARTVWNRKVGFLGGKGRTFELLKIRNLKINLQILKEV